MSPTPNHPITINYKFQFDSGDTQEFKIALDPQTLKIISDAKDSYPEWTQLVNQKCCNCPLNETQQKYCPIATQIVDLIEYFKNATASKKANVTVETPERAYTKHCEIKSAISSLLGIYMTCSGCPMMEKLRPLVRFHLPFATVEETMYRISTMYLLAQYFVSKKGKAADWTLEKLSDLYDEINLVNFGFIQRLKQLCVENANLNAVLELDYLGQNIATTLKGKMNPKTLEEIEGLFSSYA